MNVALIGLLVFQQIYWAFIAGRLINKLMSRNYFEYKQAEQAFDPRPKTVKLEEEPEDLGALDGVGGF